jgi:hypothetical protein
MQWRRGQGAVCAATALRVPGLTQRQEGLAGRAQVFSRTYITVSGRCWGCHQRTALRSQMMQLHMVTYAAQHRAVTPISSMVLTALTRLCVVYLWSVPASAPTINTLIRPLHLPCLEVLGAMGMATPMAIEAAAAGPANTR